MANRFAVANGNWSNTATWNGGTLPTSADDVYSNNFAVTVDQNIDVISLRNTTAVGINVGGNFTFNTSGVTANISDNLYNSTVTLINITATSGLITLNALNAVLANNSTVANQLLISYTGNCDLVINAIRITLLGSLNLLSRTIVKSSLGTLIITADILGGNNTTGDAGTAVIRQDALGTIIVNGRVTAGGVNSASAQAIALNAGDLTVNGSVFGGTGALVGRGAINFSSGGVLNITGNVTGSISPAVWINNGISITNITGTITGGATAAINSLAGNLNITGTITGGSGNGAVGVSINGILNHIGVAQAFLGGSAIICNTPTTSVVTCTGPFLRSGNVVAIASQTLRINAAYNPYFEFIKTPFVGVTYVNQSSLNFPTTSNVRNGITYGSGVYTGTMIVPSPIYVRFGIPTDNTIGTAIITAADLFNEIAISPNPLAVRLRTVSTVGTVGQQLITYNNL